MVGSGAVGIRLRGLNIVKGIRIFLNIFSVFVLYILIRLNPNVSDSHRARDVYGGAVASRKICAMEGIKPPRAGLVKGRWEDSQMVAIAVDGRLS